MEDEKKINKKESQKKWLSKNKDYYNTYWNEKLKSKYNYCVYCKYDVGASHKSRHEKSKKHLNNLNINLFYEFLFNIDVDLFN
jgi:hypothetical protein